MADKEERILIARSSDYTLTDTDKGELFEGKIAPHCANVFTRQDAIERMAKGLFKVDNLLALDIKWSNLKKSTQLTYKVFAEAALNALLEDKNASKN